MVAQLNMKAFFNYGPFPASFCIYFFNFLGTVLDYNLLNFTMVNVDRKGEGEGRECSVLLMHVIRKSLTPNENRLAAILN